MQIVRKETFDDTQDTPVGILEIESLKQIDQVWVPVHAKLTEFWYETQGDKRVAHPSTEVTFQIQVPTIQLNGPPDLNLFSVTWPEGTTVRDETNDSVFVVGAKDGTN
jgi:hypothetical protein